jgi:hypothetical protein
MFPSLPRLLPRVIRRKELVNDTFGKVFPEPMRATQIKITTLDHLLRHKAEAGANYPPNIRIEPVLVKQKLARVPKDTRAELKEYLKER